MRHLPDTNQPATDYLDGLIDEAAAADFLCQSVRTIQKWRVTGFGPAFFKSGRSIRYRRRELIDWIAARRPPPRQHHRHRRITVLPLRGWQHRGGFWGRKASRQA